MIRRVLVSIVMIAALTAAAPAMAQGSRDAESGFGIGIHGGFARASTWGENGVPTEGFGGGMPGFLVGLWMGGNKSGPVGFGADINYLRKGTDNYSIFGQDFPLLSGPLTLHYLEIPIWVRINFGSRQREGATFYLIAGGFVDILLQGKLAGVNIKDQFNGFDVGPLFGAGFEIFHFGVEARGNWAVRTLQSTGGGTFHNGIEKSKAFTLLLLAKIRFH